MDVTFCSASGRQIDYRGLPPHMPTNPRGVVYMAEAKALDLLLSWGRAKAGGVECSLLTAHVVEGWSSSFTAQVRVENYRLILRLCCPRPLFNRVIDSPCEALPKSVNNVTKSRVDARQFHFLAKDGIFLFIEVDLYTHFCVGFGMQEDFWSCS